MDGTSEKTDMMVTETTPVLLAVLPLDAFKAHLRLGSGFAEDGVQDGLLESFLRAALSAIEARTAKAILQRDFALEIAEAWRDAAGQALPVAPVTAIASLTLVDGDGDETVVDPGRYRLVRDRHVPVLAPVGAALPTIPNRGLARVVFTAGMATNWAEVPADLAQAVMLLAAHFYEYRNDTALSEGCMPFGASALIEKYRPMRLGYGVRA